VTSPEFWIIAGPNGAGKTTLVQAHPIRALLPRVTFLNPDDLARERLLEQGFQGFAEAPAPILRETFLTAAQTVAAQLDAALDRGAAVGVETVLSTDKYRSGVERVRERGGFVGLIYVALASPELACARVARRVRAGGHDVPTEKVQARWHRSLANLGWFATQASAFWVFDNSSDDPGQPPLLVASGQGGTVDFLSVTANACLLTALSGLPLSKAT